MNDATVRIRRFGARHHVADAGARRRALAAQRALLDGELEAALAPLAPAGELLLLRRLVLQVMLDDGASDTANARRWAEAVGTNLQRTLQHARPGELLRFASLQQAELAFVDDVLLGRQERDWAWQRLSLLPAGTPPGTPQRRAALLRLLADEPERGVPLLRALLPTPHWPALLRTLADGELRGLALAVAWRLSPALAAAWRHGDVRAGSVEAAAAAGDLVASAIDTTGPVRSWWWPTRAAAGVGAGDELAEGAGRAERLAWALRLACVLDAPALARCGAAAVDAQWQFWAARALAGGPSAASAAAGGTSTVSGQNAAPTRDDPASTAGPSADHRAGPQVPARPLATSATVPERAASTPSAADAAAFTRCGGLLLLLPLLPACGALALLEDPVLGPAANLPQRLHALALRLGAPGPRDAAALAFGALPLQRDPPPAWEPPATQTEVLDRCRERLLDHLAGRLPQWPASQRLARLLWRDARITVEPGWIDVRFALSDVSTELRRAALDLDPGFLPWLGVVLRFLYE